MHALPAQRTRLRLALLLAGAAALATLALFPYLLAMMPAHLAALKLPLPWVIALQSLQSAALCGVLAWMGLTLGSRYGLDAPWLRAWLERRAVETRWRSRWGYALVLGALSALMVLALMRLGTPTAAVAHASPAGWAWRGLLASFYGGVVEEVECRLFLVGLFVWLLARCHRGVALPWMYVAAIVLAALLFGAGHLPGAFAAGMLHAPAPIARIVLLNALVGCVTGGIFWKWGLEHAMLAHFGADLVLHVAAPLLA